MVSFDTVAYHPGFKVIIVCLSLPNTLGALQSYTFLETYSINDWATGAGPAEDYCPSRRAIFRILCPRSEDRNSYQSNIFIAKLRQSRAYLVAYFKRNLQSSTKLDHHFSHPTIYPSASPSIEAL